MASNLSHQSLMACGELSFRQRILSGQDLQALASDPNKRKVVEARVDVKAIADLVSDTTLTREEMSLKLREMLSVDDYIPFNKIKSADEHRLGLLEKGILQISPTFQRTSLGDHAKGMLLILQERWSVATEHGCRTLIDLFLLDAAHKSNSEAAIFPEWKVVGVVDGLKIGGSLDYLISLVDVPLGAGNNRRFGAILHGKTNPPYIIVIEAKKYATLHDGTIQLLAEMKVLWTNLPENQKQMIFGVLTNGVSWLFYLLAANGINYYVGGKQGSGAGVYDFIEDEGLIVSFLTHFIQKSLPPGVSCV